MVNLMEVYLVPVGVDRHELYCEVPDAAPDAVPDASHDAPALDQGQAPKGFVRRLRERFGLRRLRQRFREMLAEAERERRQPSAEPVEAGWMSRMKTRLMRWVAESIAEQRLLWHLRQQTEVTLFYPDDIDEAKAMADLREKLGKDHDKHRFWLIIDSLGFVVSGLLMLVPGPNLLAYYFAFRLVGHYLSMRGARQGLSVVEWRPEPSAPLTELRRTLGLAREQREQQVDDIAHRLRLEHLGTFFERTSVPLS